MKVVNTEELDKIFYRKVKEIQPDLFVEAGAWDGSTSLRVLKLSPNTEIHAYEANKYVHEKFVDNFKDKSASYHNLALSEKSGKAKFFVQLTHRNNIVQKTKKNNSLKERNEPGMSYEPLEVNMDTIDNLHSGYENVVMWVDVEGVGLEVLKGASNLLDSVKMLKIEVESHQFWKDQLLDDKIIEYLTQKGFNITYRDEERKDQYNIIFEK